MRVGCYQCHGTDGQGNEAGPALTPDTLPAVAIAAFIRTSPGRMPVYPKESLSDAEIDDIVAFLAANEGNLGQRGPNYESRDSDALEENRVSDVMTGEMISVNPETPLPEVVALMNERRIHRVLVQEGGKPVGVVSTLDVLGVVTQA